MTLSEQVDSLQARVAELKTSLDASRNETSEQVKARIAAAKAKADATRAAVADKAAETADRADSQWQSFKADVSAKMDELKACIDRQRDQQDVKAAERDAVRAEENAADSLDFAAWAIDVAEGDVLDAVDARAWADAGGRIAPQLNPGRRGSRNERPVVHSCGRTRVENRTYWSGERVAGRVRRGGVVGADGVLNQDRPSIVVETACS